MMADLQSDRVERTTSITDKTRNDYRNPTVAEAMKVLGFVNKYGRGVLRAQAELRGNGNPEAEYHFDTGFVQVTVRGAAS